MAVALFCGLLIALFYDIYWLLAANIKRPLWLRALQDILFWLASFCLVAALWMFFTGGIMRLYVYLWLGAGIILFRLIIKGRLRKLALPRLNLPTPQIKIKTNLPANIMLRAGLGLIKTGIFCKKCLKNLKNLVAAFFKK